MIQTTRISNPQAQRTAQPNRRGLAIAALLSALFLLTGCEQTGSMRNQPRYEPLEASTFFEDGMSARGFVPGTVPFQEEGSPNDPALTGLDENGEPVEGFPQEVTAEMVALGQEEYNIFCTVCHGPTGAGDGPVTNLGFPNPPGLLEESAQGLSNGEIFDIITNGRGQMYPYGYRVKPAERWAVIAYVRAMQLKNGEVDPQALTADELNQLGNMP